MRRFIFTAACSLFALMAMASVCLATPTHYGSSGLLNQPTSQTLNEGNICIGLWTNCTAGNDRNGVILPATITLGLGTFMEVYGAYPNLLFNDDEGVSGRGFADIGFKFRIYGKRSDPFRMGLDAQARRSIADDPTRDGLTDYATTLIATFKREKFGLNATAGYIMNDSPDFEDYDNQYTVGAGVEYFPVNRLRGIAEVSYESEKVPGEDGPAEATVGFQYFLTPHLTMNAGVGLGLTDAGPDYRFLFGISTCQGVGTFNRPVPRLVDSSKLDESAKAPPKVVKIKLLTPLIPHEGAVVKSPLSHLELPLPEPREQVTIDPADQMPMPDISAVDVQAVAPMSLPLPEVTNRFVSGPFQATVYRKFSLPDLTFGFDQYSLTKDGMLYLSMVADELRRENREFFVSIEGHTDKVGSDTYNRKLSFQRAVSAATHLVLKNGLDPARMFVKGHGESQPVADNTTEDGRVKNRRVELLVLIPASASSSLNFGQGAR